MVSILDQILDTKRREVALAKSRTPVEELKARIAGSQRPRNFFRAVTTPGKKTLNLIAEVKKASPSAGVIRADFDPAAIARAYAAAGADASACSRTNHIFRASWTIFGPFGRRYSFRCCARIS